MKQIFDEEQCLDEVGYLLFYRIDSDDDGTRTVFFYSPSQTSIKRRPSAQAVAEQWRRAAKDPLNWKTNFSTTERIVAELYIQGHSAPFLIRYYSVGPDDGSRIASFFVQERKTGEPILSGALDYPNPATRERVEKFYPKVKHKPAWKTWAYCSFAAEHHVSPVLRIQEKQREYVGLYTEAKLFSYAEGFIKGGLPFGSEDTFLAVSEVLDSKWLDALDLYKGCFQFWNLVCRHKSLERVFIQGEPGAGKELWYEAIQGGVKARLKGEWKSMAATLPATQLDELLYGEQSGTLERIGYLKQCEGGGIFRTRSVRARTCFERIY